MTQDFRKITPVKLSSSEQHNQKNVSNKPTLKIAVLAGASIILGAVIFLIIGTLPQKVKADGIFISEGSISTVAAENGGIISDVLVSIGDQVSAGQEIARFNTDEARKQLDELSKRRSSVDIITFDSEKDAATDDNKELLDIKSNWNTGVSNLAANKTLLESKEKELAEQKKKTSAAKDDLEKAKKAFDATKDPVDTTSKQKAYEDARADLQTAKNNLESAESALTPLQSKVDDLQKDRKPYADELSSAKNNLSEAQAEAMSAKSHMKDMESDMLAAKSNWESAEFAFQSAGPNEDRPALAAAADAAKSSYNNAYDFYTEAQNTYDKAAAKVKDAQEIVNARQKTVDNIDLQISTAESELASAKSQVDTCKEELSAAQTACDTAEKAYSDAKQAEAKRKSDNSSANTKYQAASNDYSKASKQLSSLQDSVDKLKTQVANEEADLDKLKPELIRQFNNAKNEVLEKLDQEIDKYEQMIENSAIRSKMNGYISEINIAKGDTVQQDSIVCSIATDAKAERVVICYVPAAEGRKLAPGMRVEVNPSEVIDKEYGHMEGTIQEVHQSGSSQEEIRKQLGDESLAQRFTQKGAVVAVKVVLRTDPNTVSGYWWSGKKGAEATIAEGTIISADIVTKE